MKLGKRALIAFATVSVVGLGVTSHVHAGAYALSYNNVSNFIITPSGPGATNIGLNLPSTLDVNASASITGLGAVIHQSNGDVDVNPAKIGLLPPSIPLPGVDATNNTFTPIGPNGNAYAQSDAWIPFQQTEGDPFTQAVNFAEAFLPGTPVGVTGNAEAGNASDTSFSVTLTVAGDTTFSFEFDAHPYLEADVIVPPVSTAPSVARAQITANINITGANGTVFNWSPDGIVNAGGGCGAGGVIVGGCELDDSFTLNNTVAQNFATAGAASYVYDPLGLGVGAVGILTPNYRAGLGAGPGPSFRAITNTLAAGTYTLTVQLGENVTVRSETSIPEPATLALMGMGLLGLGAMGRRKKKIV